MVEDTIEWVRSRKALEKEHGFCVPEWGHYPYDGVQCSFEVPARILKADAERRANAAAEHRAYLATLDGGR